MLRWRAAPGPADDWTGLQSGVISRMRAEAHESWTARTRRMFDDMHLVWIGLASAAPPGLWPVALGAVHFASPERDDSLAAMIAVISAPSGSDLNPVKNDQFLQVPTVPERRGPIEFMLAQPMTRDEAGARAQCGGDAGRGRSGLSVLSDDSIRARSITILDGAVSTRPQLEPGADGRVAGRREPRVAAGAHDGQGQGAADYRPDFRRSKEKADASFAAFTYSLRSSQRPRSSRRCSSRRWRG